MYRCHQRGAELIPGALTAVNNVIAFFITSPTLFCVSLIAIDILPNNTALKKIILLNILC